MQLYLQMVLVVVKVMHQLLRFYCIQLNNIVRQDKLKRNKIAPHSIAACRSWTSVHRPSTVQRELMNWSHASVAVACARRMYNTRTT